MRTRCVRVSREEKKFAGGLPPVALVEKAVESLARADDPFLSLSSRLFFCYAAPRSVNNGSTGESWRATTCLGCPAAAVLSALGRSVRAHRRRKKKSLNLTPQSARFAPTTFTTPSRLSLSPSGSPVCFSSPCYAARYGLRVAFHWLAVCPRVVTTFHLTHGEPPFISARQSPWTNDVDRLYTRRYERE